MTFNDGIQKKRKYFDRIEKQYEKEIASVYKNALDEIRKEMSVIFEKYAQNGVLSRADMTRYNRLTSLEKNISLIVSQSTKEVEKIINKLRPEEYSEAFFRTAYAFDNGARVSLDWGPLKKDSIVAAMESPFYESAIDRSRALVGSQVRNAINKGLALGQSYTDMIKDMKELINLKNYELMRIARTELHRAEENGTVAGYEDAQEQGIKGQIVWIATIDNKTRDTHIAMDGKVRGDDGYFDGPGNEKLEYPGDPNAADPGEVINCRCSTFFQIDGFEPTIRRERNEGLIPGQTTGNVTYEQWKENHPTF